MSLSLQYAHNALTCGSYRNDGIKLTAVIFVHPISDNRMTGASLRNLRLVSELLGQDNRDNLLFVSSMWDRIDMTSGEAREAELSDDEKYWKPFLEDGAQKSRYFRCQSEPESARNVLSGLVHLPPIVLRIQEEMTTQCLPLSQTGVGKVIGSDLVKLVEDQRASIIALRQEHLDAVQYQRNAFEEYMEAQRMQLSESEQSAGEHETWQVLKGHILNLGSALNSSLRDFTFINPNLGDTIYPEPVSSTQGDTSTEDTTPAEEATPTETASVEDDAGWSLLIVESAVM